MFKLDIDSWRNDVLLEDVSLEIRPNDVALVHRPDVSARVRFVRERLETERTGSVDISLNKQKPLILCWNRFVKIFSSERFVIDQKL